MKPRYECWQWPSALNDPPLHMTKELMFLPRNQVLTYSVAAAADTAQSVSVMTKSLPTCSSGFCSQCTQ